MNTKLAEFLNNAASKPFKWGEFDCCLWLADWYVAATGKPDPAPHLRGAYADMASCIALCGPLGYARITQQVAEAAGLQRTHDPLRGDIGIIRTRPGPALGAIKARYGWVFLSHERGISSIHDTETTLRVMRAWRVN